MHFLLTSLNVLYVLTTPQPQEQERETPTQTRNMKKWENDEYARYMCEDATSKKFLISQFNGYTMSDSRSVMEQFHELERMLGNFKQDNMSLDESIVVASIIDKLRPCWKDFKRSLKYKKEDVSLEELANSLRIEEDFRNDEGGKDRNVLVVETGQSSGGVSYKGKEKAKHHCKDKKIGKTSSRLLLVGFAMVIT
ncbi:hypothetical protein LIER_40626 [Lithospermum erythrorhizon]|uniref:Zinc finger, CCHC-type n=1 Tax=Lithospermum erythrorhizon TaxID=34254 RepID=A0AAV3QYM6_LITER